MRGPKISEVKAREVLDSKGRPMVEVDVWASDGSMGRGGSPCGTSVGRHEAFVLRDGGKRYGGLGVKKAINHVETVIAPALLARDLYDQRGIDESMKELDGTPNKSRLGANAIYSVSIAVARAAASSLGIPLYRYLGGTNAYRLPVPMFNMINGGPYSGGVVEFQEFMLLPEGAETYGEALQMGVEVFYKLEGVIRKRHGDGAARLGSSAGYGAPVMEPAGILETLLEACDAAGYGGRFRVGLDCAASHFYDEARDCYSFKGREISGGELITFLEDLAKAFPFFMIEDPLHEDDFEGFSEITRRLPHILITGDDLFVTDTERLKKGISLGAANAMIFKPNMIGTISEALDAADYAKSYGYCVIPSGRAGGTADDPVAEIAVAVGSPLAKSGAPRTAERISKQNCWLRIEEELGAAARLSPLPGKIARN